jgi:hypothetical protein
VHDKARNLYLYTARNKVPTVWDLEGRHEFFWSQRVFEKIVEYFQIQNMYE